MSLERAIVVGGLGGLGGALTRELALRDIEVTIVDNLDPASAPHVHHRHRAERLTALSDVTLVKLDVRSGEMDELVESQSDADLYYCASPNPTRPHPANSTLAAELTLHRPQDLAKLRHRVGDPIGKTVIAQWTPIADDSDPRRGHTVWETILEYEELTRSFAEQLEDVETVTLPMLIGGGMNPWLPPLLPARQIASRIPAQIPREEYGVHTLPLDVAAKQLVATAFEEKFSLDTSEASWPTPYRTLAEFALLAELDLEELRGEIAPWGPPTDGVAPISEGEAAQSLLAELIALPHSPELDWPVSAKRRKKRSKRNRDQ